MLIGNDPFQFEVVDHFGDLPDYIKLGNTHGVTVDIHDNVYVFNESRSAVVILDKTGKYLRSWGEEFMHGAHGMRLTNEQRQQFLYLTDYTLHHVVKTSLRGDVQFTLKLPPRPDIYSSIQEYKPTDACVAPNGDIYVCDGYGKAYIHVYNRAGRYLTSFGGMGSDEGRLNTPHGAWVDTRKATPELYVADRGNNRIQVFSLDGTFKRIITDPAIIQPCGFYQYADELWVPDLSARLVVLDGHDHVAAVLGDNPQAPTTPGWPNIQDQMVVGKFNSPHACAIDTQGDVYVVEWVNTGRLTKLIRKSKAPERAPLRAEHSV